MRRYLDEPAIISTEQRGGNFGREPVLLIIGSALYSLALRGLDAFAIPLFIEG